MADGTFALLTLIAGVWDVSTSDCSGMSECFAWSDDTPRVSIAAGEWLERAASVQEEIYIRYDMGTKVGPFGTTIGLSLAENGETWLGAGPTYTFAHNALYAQLHVMGGLYEPNGGFDLGGSIEFRSGIELGFEGPNGWRYGISYDHRSNTGILSDINPGVETLMLRVSVPLR